MSIEISDIEYCKIKVKYEGTTEEVSSKKDEIVNKFKKYKVPGFRPGKGTAEAVRLYFAKEIDQALRQELAQSAYYNTVSEKNIKPFGNPNFDNLTLDGTKFNCEFSMYKQPDFELAIYKEFEIPKPAPITTSTELTQKMLQELRTKFGKTTLYSDADVVCNGDAVILDHKAFINDEEVKELSSEGEIVNVGQTTVPGFDEQLLGMKVGETREFSLKMPESFNDYANQTIRFMVKLIRGSKVEPAALDDELSKKIGLETFDKLMEQITAMANNRVKEFEHTQIVNQISNRLVANHEFVIPHWLALTEAQMAVKQSGKEWDAITDTEKERAMQKAEKSVKLTLVLNKIRENEPDAQLSDDEVFATAKQAIQQNAPDPDKTLEEVMKSGMIGMFFARIRDEHTLSFIEKSCKIIE
jgi:trigger factor